MSHYALSLGAGVNSAFFHFNRESGKPVPLDIPYNMPAMASYY